MGLQSEKLLLKMEILPPPRGDQEAPGAVPQPATGGGLGLGLWRSWVGWKSPPRDGRPRPSRRQGSVPGGGCTLEHPRQTTIITAHTGESVLLPCSCTEIQAKPERFTWEKYNTKRNTLDVISNESEPYRNRVQLGTAHSPGNLSLLISHLTEEDGGLYRCGLKSGGVRDITLTVKGISTRKFTPRSDSTTRSKAPSDPSTTESSERAGTQAEDSPQTPPYFPVAMVTVIFLHIIVAVVYCTKRNKDHPRLHYSTADGDGALSL
ncbi:uncharacterized protein LOC143522692 isoform X3 [Brachyhypopomus gauderio]|uniref:uncharacterized protein LOC143522692 isoform X3 n=1 Tax=Brachyhypopomus gauderio TaxID=698409 RepID=UPI00404279AB